PDEADIHRRPSLDCAVLVACQSTTKARLLPCEGERRPRAPSEQLEIPVLWAHHAARRRAGCSEKGEGRGLERSARQGNASRQRKRRCRVGGTGRKCQGSMRSTRSPNRSPPLFCAQNGGDCACYLSSD